MNKQLARVLATAAACAFPLVLTGCAGSGEGVRVEGPSGIPRAQADIDAVVIDTKPGATALKTLAGARVNIAEGQTVGVGMPVSVTFEHTVPATERAEVERQLKVTTDPGAEGSWSWIEDRAVADGQRVDFRPRAYWKPGTKVTVQVGADLSRHFTVGRQSMAGGYG